MRNVERRLVVLAGMVNKTYGQINEIGRNVEDLAGYEVRVKVMEGSEGMRFDRQGNSLIQYYIPLSFGDGMRCYCSLLRGLPARPPR
jgi:hypothetical protein